MLNVDVLRKVGREHAKILRKGAQHMEQGKKIEELVDFVEGMIQKARFSPAFPTNVCINNVAAHYTPELGEQNVLNGVVKLDVGLHSDGWITDAAITVDLSGENGRIVMAAKEALEAGIDAIRPNVPVAEVGRAIYETAKRYGFKTIINLGGHEIGRYKLHAGLFIPNIPKGKGTISEGMVVAIEPFLTAGEGYVHETNDVRIFGLGDGRPRSQIARKVYSYVLHHYKTLPFAFRWIEREFGKNIRLVIPELVRTRAFRQYPVLSEKGGVVAQFETTVYVDTDGAEPLVNVMDI